MRAIIFDFYDTLVFRDEATTLAARRAIADLIDVPLAQLSEVWRRHRNERMLGAIATLEEHLRVVSAELGRELTPAQIAEAARLERDGQRRSVHPYPEARRVLTELRRRGFQLGLLTNTSDVAAEPVWGLGIGHLCDAVVLSHEVGILKPDPRIYQLACERLRVRPAECAFVADGGFGELDAAHELGMLAVRVDQAGQSKDYGTSNYADVTLTNLADLLTLAATWRPLKEAQGG